MTKQYCLKYIDTDIRKSFKETKMTKILLVISALIVFTNTANAQFSGAPANPQYSGGFEGPSLAPSMPTTVKAALAARDDTMVVLSGRIINSLGDEKYTFKDNTGEIIVEIDDDEWNGVKVTPDNIVEITGEVDKEWYKPTKIDVKSLRIKQ